MGIQNLCGISKYRQVINTSETYTCIKIFYIIDSYLIDVMMVSEYVIILIIVFSQINGVHSLISATAGFGINSFDREIRGKRAAGRMPFTIFRSFIDLLIIPVEVRIPPGNALRIVYQAF